VNVVQILEIAVIALGSIMSQDLKFVFSFNMYIGSLDTADIATLPLSSCFTIVLSLESKVCNLL